MGFLELAGLEEWREPETAAAATVDSQKKLQAALIATRLVLQARLHGEENRAAARRIQTDLDELRHTGILLASLLRAELER